MVSHIWKLDESGDIDTFVWEYEYHLGPMCRLCYASPCIHCERNWRELECPYSNQTTLFDYYDYME